MLLFPSSRQPMTESIPAFLPAFIIFSDVKSAGMVGMMIVALMLFMIGVAAHSALKPHRVQVRAARRTLRK